MDVGLFVEFPCRDGMSEQEAFAECFTLVDEAEASGVASVWLAEYHFAPISVLSSPLMVASAIAARTRRIRIGLAVTLLPLYHPIHVAEDVATLDHISQGRVEFGVGRGTFPDTHDGFNSPFAESRERFDEYLEVILKAWTTERFSFSGKYYRCEDLRAPAADSTAKKDEDEEIEPRTFTVNEARELVTSGEIVDLKTLAGLSLI